MSDDSEMYEIEEILSHKPESATSHKDTETYHVHWLGFDDCENSDEPAVELSKCTDLLETYWQKVENNRAIMNGEELYVESSESPEDQKILGGQLFEPEAKNNFNQKDYLDNLFKKALEGDTYNETSTPLNEDAKSQDLKPTVDEMKQLEIKDADKKPEEKAISSVAGIKDCDKKKEENVVISDGAGENVDNTENAEVAETTGVTGFYVPKKKRSVSIQFLAQEIIKKDKEMDEKLEKRIQLLLKFYHDERMPLKYKNEIKDLLEKLEVKVQ